MITRKEELLLLLIEDAKGKDTVQTLNARLAPLRVGMQDDLGIGARAEGMPIAL